MEHRQFTFKEAIRNIWNAGRGFVILKTLKKKGFMTKKDKEEIMLAITHVNGCRMCSYVHTNIALSSGMSKEDIVNLLEGDHSNVQAHNAVAVLFAQHFADSKESPSPEAIQRLLDEYGYQRTKMVVGASYMITMTNAMGISMDAFLQRLKFKKIPGSRLSKEVLFPLLTMVLFPLSFLYFRIYCFFKNLEIPILQASN